MEELSIHPNYAAMLWYDMLYAMMKMTFLPNNLASNADVSYIR